MSTFILYLICLLPASLVVAAYILLKHFSKINERFYHIFLRVLCILSMTFFGLSLFHVRGVMIGKGVANGLFQEGVGCVNLIGVPYGDNRFLNFLAWLSNALFLPGAFVVTLSVFFPSKEAKLLNKFIAFPIACLEAIFLFNYINALTGDLVLSYQNVFLSLEVGLFLALSAILFASDFKEAKFSNWKEIVYVIVLYLTVFVCSLPVNTFSTLIDSVNTIPMGTLSKSLRAVDFYPTHRVFLYVGIALPVFIYFFNRHKDVNLKKVITIAASLGALSVFLTSYGAYGIFTRDASNNLGISVNSLPIHLCHTALYIVPICIAFNLKRLFYFTYFINVFGAIMAMMWPNVGDNLNYLSSDVVLFWYNHIAAYSMPLLVVALGIFEKPKMKQMIYSLIFFTIYMFSIVVLNAWLSNYVDGYNPDVIGSGTDYLFINGTYILDIISDQAYHMLDIKLKWTWGNATFVIYPLYQAIFYLGYVSIAFAMWFVYSLFFKIADSHISLHDQLIIMKNENISFKEKVKMAELEKERIDHTTASLKYIDFSKRYGTSKRLSADHVNLEVKAGEIFGFLGPNGAGKSTCIKTTIGIQPVTEGTIEVCGYNVSTQSVESKKLIGYVPDHYALYEKLTGREYINYIADLYGVSKEDRDTRISKYVDLFELTQAFDNRMQTYSHGMKQKMTIMAALVHNPKVWILDEPLTGLDPQSIYQVKEVMKEHAKAGNIVFFSSHIINVVEKLCTRIAIIRKGHIVFEGSMKDVEKEHPEGLEEFYMSMIRDTEDDDA